MRDEPSAALTDLLARLHLATPEQVRKVQGGARKLARDLPLFDSVWIDALAQVRLLTHFQATEINAGRGEQLLIGPYVLRRRIQRLDYADCFLAASFGGVENSSSDGETKADMHLVAVRGLKPTQAAQAAGKLQIVLQQLNENPTPGVIAIQAAGHHDGTLWAAYTPTVGFTIGQWLPCHGRLSPAAALEIARQMVAVLKALEQVGLVHGDISASSLWLNDVGQTQLAYCGVRAALSQNLFAAADEMHACGLLWWHLLTGRSALVTNNSESKSLVNQGSTLENIRRIAPDVPTVLATAIERCTQSDPALRPSSFAELAELLGPPSTAGRRQLAAEIADSGRPLSGTPLVRRAGNVIQQSAQPLLAATACALLLAAATWPLWRARPSVNEPSTTKSALAASETHRWPEAQRNLAKENSATDPLSGSVQSAISGNDLRSRAVRQVNFETATKPQENAADAQPSVLRTESTKTQSPAQPILELNGATETAGSTLHLQPGMTVRGKAGVRPCIVMPPNGLIVAVDQVRFENIDFVWRQRPEEITSPDQHALVDLRAAGAEFVDCTFRAQAAGSFELPCAVRINGKLGQGIPLVPTARVRMECCALRNMSCGIDCETRGPAAIEFQNSLYLGNGPLVRFSQARPVDAPAAVTLDHVTVRGATAIVELHGDDLTDACGPVEFNTTACVLAPEESGAFVVFVGRHWPKSTGGAFAAIEWTGQDSLACAALPAVAWRHDTTKEPLPDDALAIDGLVASPFEFVGPASGGPANSRLLKWLAPGRTEFAPGIGENLPRWPDLP